MTLDELLKQTKVVDAISIICFAWALYQVACIFRDVLTEVIKDRIRRKYRPVARWTDEEDV